MVKGNGFFHLVFLSSLIILNSNAYYVFHYKYDFYIYCVSSTMINFIDNNCFNAHDNLSSSYRLYLSMDTQ